MAKFLFSFIALLPVSLFASMAHAGCELYNDTGYNFKMDIKEAVGSTSTTMSSHSTESKQAGFITAKTDTGQSFSTSCKDGDRLRIYEKNGVIVVEPR